MPHFISAFILQTDSEAAGRGAAMTHTHTHTAASCYRLTLCVRVLAVLITLSFSPPLSGKPPPLGLDKEIINSQHFKWILT